MQIIVKGKGTTLTEPLKEYAAKKMQHLEHFFANIQKVEIMLEVDPIREADKAQVVHVTTWAAHKVMRASAEAADLYAALDLVLDKLVEQTKKLKDKLSKEKRRGERKAKETPAAE